MIKLIKFLSIFATACSAFCVYAETNTAVNADVVNQTISTFMANNDIPGVAVQLYVKGQPSSYYYGFADRDKKIPVTNKTIFEMGSISKVMTSILLAQEVDFAKMSFNDPVKKYITDLPATFNHITLQNLATHTSGLPRNVPNNVITQAELKDYLAHWQPTVDPSDRWQYSNVGIGLLGDALASSTQWDFNKLYIRHILNPLSMLPISTTVPAKFTKYIAQGYDNNGNPTKPYQPELFPSAGGLKVMAGDMQPFLGAAIGLPGTPPRLMWPIRMTQTTFVKYAGKQQGLAWSIHPIKEGYITDLLDDTNDYAMDTIAVDAIYERPPYDGNALIDKTGTTQGFRAYIAVIPNKKTGIVILANKNVPNTAIVRTARELLFKLNKMTS